MPLLTPARIEEAAARIETGPFIAGYEYIEEIGSTNDRARQLADEDVPEGSIVITDYQKTGRGRMGRGWEAPPATSLLMSSLFRPDITPERATRLMMICGLAIAEAVEALGVDHVDIKWPNDLLIGGKKFCGILPESSIIGDQLAYVIVGTGVNVNQAIDPDDPLHETATSLHMATGATYDRAALLAAIFARMNEWYAKLGSVILTTAWGARCITLGKWVRAETAEGEIVGQAEVIDDIGSLWVRDRDDQTHQLTSGEATILAQSLDEPPDIG